MHPSHSDSHVLRSHVCVTCPAGRLLNRLTKDTESVDVQVRQLSDRLKQTQKRFVKPDVRAVRHRPPPCPINSNYRVCHRGQSLYGTDEPSTLLHWRRCGASLLCATPHTTPSCLCCSPVSVPELLLADQRHAPWRPFTCTKSQFPHRHAWRAQVSGVLNMALICVVNAVLSIVVVAAVAPVALVALVPLCFLYYRIQVRPHIDHLLQQQASYRSCAHGRQAGCDVECWSRTVCILRVSQHGVCMLRYNMRHHLHTAFLAGPLTPAHL